MKLLTDQMLDISVEEMQEQAFIKEVWSGILGGKRFREMILKSLDIYEVQVPKLKKNQSKFLLLADTTGIDMINTKEIEWLDEEINPIYEQLGFTHQAVIMPKSFFARSSVKNYEGVSESGLFTTNMFEDNLSAFRWFFKK